MVCYMTENQWRDKEVIPFLKSLPKTYYFIKNADSIRGIPDIIACVNGRFIALELKKSKECLDHPRTALQSYTINLIRDAMGKAYFAYPDNWNFIKATLAYVASLPLDNESPP